MFWTHILSLQSLPGNQNPSEELSLVVKNHSTRLDLSMNYQQLCWNNPWRYNHVGAPSEPTWAQVGHFLTAPETQDPSQLDWMDPRSPVLYVRALHGADVMSALTEAPKLCGSSPRSWNWRALTRAPWPQDRLWGALRGAGPGQICPWTTCSSFKRPWRYSSTRLWNRSSLSVEPSLVPLENHLSVLLSPATLGCFLYCPGVKQ